MVDDLTPYLKRSTSAVLVIDMQNDFCHPDGAFAKRGLDLTSSHQMIPVLRTFVDTARSLGTPIIHVRSFMDHKFLPPSMLARNKQMGREKGICPEGEWGSEFYEIIPEPDETVVTKHVYSAFIGTDLQDKLATRGITSLMVTGVLTNVCCESTLRDGYMLGYYTFLVEDCCASIREAAHRASVENVRNYFGWVCTSNELISLLRR